MPMPVATRLHDGGETVAGGLDFPSSTGALSKSVWPIVGDESRFRPDYVFDSTSSTSASLSPYSW